MAVTDVRLAVTNELHQPRLDVSVVETEILKTLDLFMNNSTKAHSKTLLVLVAVAGSSFGVILLAIVAACCWCCAKACSRMRPRRREEDYEAAAVHEPLLVESRPLCKLPAVPTRASTVRAPEARYNPLCKQCRKEQCRTRQGYEPKAVASQPLASNWGGTANGGRLNGQVRQGVDRNNNSRAASRYRRFANDEEMAEEDCCCVFCFPCCI